MLVTVVDAVAVAVNHRSAMLVTVVDAVPVAVNRHVVVALSRRLAARTR